MTQNYKPEWFEITDADEKPALRKVSKSLPVSAVLVAALILGAGVVVGQTQSDTSISSIPAASVQLPSAKSNPTSQAISTVDATSPEPTNAATANPITTTAAVAGTVVAGTVVAGAVATNKLANPSISKLPVGGDDDDDNDDDDDDDDDDRD